MPRITKVTTRRGDDGNTDLADGRRVRKDSKRIQAVGSLDELNSAIGWARAQSPSPDTAARLLEIQNDLLCAGAMLAGASRKSRGPVLDPARIEFLERGIASFQEKLGPLENFLLPGGTSCAAALHLARAVCRRAERDVIVLSRTSTVPPDIRIYLNRLSDLLFQCARLENKLSGVSESLWESR
ncbi:MAG: cob(I)yrinic acid a,c-diamide adenosyltransferase [Anaerolineales bacterium]